MAAASEINDTINLGPCKCTLIDTLLAGASNNPPSLCPDLAHRCKDASSPVVRESVIRIWNHHINTSAGPSLGSARLWLFAVAKWLFVNIHQLAHLAAEAGLCKIHKLPQYLLQFATFRFSKQT